MTIHITRGSLLSLIAMVAMAVLLGTRVKPAPVARPATARPAPDLDAIRARAKARARQRMADLTANMQANNRSKYPAFAEAVRAYREAHQ